MSRAWENTVSCGGRANKCQNSSKQCGRCLYSEAFLQTWFPCLQMPSKVEVVKREHRNVGSTLSSHDTCLKDVRDELPIGSVARKISEGSSDVRLECRTRAVRICKAALRHPWIHSPHRSVNGDPLSSCSKCGKKLQSLGCFPIYRGRNPCATSDLPPVLEERALSPEIWVPCCPETLVLRNSVLRQRSWLGARKLRFVGVVRRLSTGPVQTVDGVFLRGPHERGCLRSSILGLMARCCKRSKHLLVMIFGNKGVSEAAVKNSREPLIVLWKLNAGQNVHIS